MYTAFWLSAHPGNFPDLWWLFDHKLTSTTVTNPSVLGPGVTDFKWPDRWEVDYNGILTYHKQFFPWMQTKSPFLEELLGVIHDHSNGQWDAARNLHSESRGNYKDLEDRFLEWFTNDYID